MIVGINFVGGVGVREMDLYMIKIRGINNTPKNKSHHAWKGEEVKYSGLHTWLRKEYGNANKCENKDCDKSSTLYEWANISGEYHRTRSDYKMMCRKCHSIMDKSKFCKNGHARTVTNTKLNKSGTRRCLLCQAIERGWPTLKYHYSAAQ